MGLISIFKMLLCVICYLNINKIKDNFKVLQDLQGYLEMSFYSIWL